MALNPLPATLLDTGRTVSFKSKHDRDVSTWRGSVVGVVTYAQAKTYGDVDAYHGAVRQSDATLPELASQLKYFLIQRPTGVGGKSTPEPFAAEWVRDGTWTVEDPAEELSIIVYKPVTMSSTEVIRLLESAGLKSRIVTV